MSLAVSVKDAGIGLALRRMVALLAPGGMKPVFNAMGAKLESNTHQRFDTKTDPDGHPWAAWSDETAAAREKEGRGTILEYTGRMRDSLTYLADAQGVEVGFGVDYAQWQEPHRHMLFSESGGLGQEDMNDALKAGMAAFRKQLKLSGSLAL